MIENKYLFLIMQMAIKIVKIQKIEDETSVKILNIGH